MSRLLQGSDYLSRGVLRPVGDALRGDKQDSYNLYTGAKAVTQVTLIPLFLPGLG
jgi:hypothetical protein